jgi:cytochrome c peroxidase
MIRAMQQSRRGRAWAVILVAMCVGCADRTTGPSIPSGNPLAFVWELPAGFPAPPVPADNPMSPAKVELGRRLFYDVRLSGNQTFSCSSCHRQQDAFADARNLPIGSTGEPHPRNSMGLTNVGYQPVFGWANPNTRVLERQALIPMFGDAPVELGLKGREAELLARLRAVQLYRSLFSASFPGQAEPITLDNLTRALASFQRTFLTGASPYDRFKRGDAGAISESAKRGELLFRSDRLKCAECHSGVLFTKDADYGGSPTATVEFINNGLYNIGGTGAYPANNTGLYEHTRVSTDMGRFKIPTLRNIALTYPYMHDGSVATLDDVIDHYAAGGRTIASGANAGVGSQNPYKSPLIGGFTLTPQERVDLLSFLRSLTDSGFIRNPKLSNPWVGNVGRE